MDARATNLLDAPPPSGLVSPHNGAVALQQGPVREEAAPGVARRRAFAIPVKAAASAGPQRDPFATVPWNLPRKRACRL